MHGSQNDPLVVTAGGQKTEMKTFKEFLADEEAETKIVIYHYDTDDLLAEFLIQRLLTEARPSVDLGGGKSIIHHKAHIPNTEDHLHFRVKEANIYSLNKNGSAHDSSHGIQMQRWAVDGAKKYYPNFTIPKDGLIEQIMPPLTRETLNEEFGGNRILVSEDELSRALAVASAE